MLRTEDEIRDSAKKILGFDENTGNCWDKDTGTPVSKVFL